MVDVAARIPDEAAVPVLVNDPPMPRPDRLLEKLAADIAMPYQNALIKE